MLYKCHYFYYFPLFPQVVQLGVQLRPVSPGQMNLTLLYTDVTKYSTTQPIASFLIPAPTGKYFKFALKVTTDGVTAFVNCEEIESTRVVRNPQELLFDSASTLYLGQAGPIIKGALDVSEIPFELGMTFFRAGGLFRGFQFFFLRR